MRDCKRIKQAAACLEHGVSAHIDQRVLSQIDVRNTSLAVRNADLIILRQSGRGFKGVKLWRGRG
eukprot:3641877-Alexandrium_andersonii.AAC.1